MSWLKDGASENIPYISLTLSTAQPPMSWLKDEAWQNMWFISVTP